MGVISDPPWWCPCGMNFGCNASSRAKASILRIPQRSRGSKRQGQPSSNSANDAPFFLDEMELKDDLLMALMNIDDRWCWHFCSHYIKWLSNLYNFDVFYFKTRWTSMQHVCNGSIAVFFILMTWLRLGIIGPDAPITRWRRSRCERAAGEGAGEESGPGRPWKLTGTTAR